MFDYQKNVEEMVTSRDLVRVLSRIAGEGNQTWTPPASGVRCRTYLFGSPNPKDNTIDENNS